jgi:hypothetical protein
MGLFSSKNIMQVEIKDGKLVITLPIQAAMSKSGKSEVIASTHGNVRTSTTYKDKPITIGVNAYVSR